MLLSGCAGRYQSTTDLQTIVLQDRNGFSETVSAPERLQRLEKQNFDANQPYAKVIRVFERDPDGALRSVITTYHPNGQLYQRLEAKDGRAHGAYQEYFPNGQQRISAFVQGGTADLAEEAMTSWQFDRDSLVWRETGSLEAILPYQNGVMHGQERYFYPGGQLQHVRHYVEGKLHGRSIELNREGGLLAEENYVSGQPDGSWRRWWPSGAAQAEELWERGKLLSGAYWSSAGEGLFGVDEGYGMRPQFRDSLLWRTCQVSAGAISGELREFDANGRLVRCWSEMCGIKQGEETLFDPATGRPKLIMSWADDRLSGPVKTFYPSGATESHRNLSENKLHGQSIAWYPNGQIMLIEQYDQDKLMRGEYYSLGCQHPISAVIDGVGTVSLFGADGAPERSFKVIHGEPIP